MLKYASSCSTCLSAAWQPQPMSAKCLSSLTRNMAAKPYRLRCSLVGHSMDVRAVAAAHFPDGAIVTGSRDRTTRIWIPNEGSSDYFEGQCLTGPTNFVSSVCTVPPSDQHPSGLILVGSNDCCVYCFSPDSPQPLYKLLGHSGVGTSYDHF